MLRLRFPNVSITLSHIDYIFIFLCVIFLGSATVFTWGSLESFIIGDNNGYEGIIGKLVMFVFSLIVLKLHNVNFFSCFEKKIIILILIWGILQFIKYKAFSFYPIVRIMNLYFASVLIFCYGRKLIYILDDIFVKLAKIDVILWGMLLLIPEIIENLLYLSPIKGAGLVNGNSWLVFASGSQYELFLRNVGFAWEPGRFGCIMSIAFFMHLVINKFKIIDKTNYLFLFLSILSTQSTTAYMVFCYIILIYLYNTNRKYFLFTLPIILGIIFYMLSFDFMIDKMQKLSIFNADHQIDWQQSLDYYSTQDRIIVPQRFDALFLEYLNILHDPLIGNATDTFSYLYDRFHVKFSLSNGILRIFANMGIFIGFLYYILCIKSSRWMSTEYKYKGSMAFLLLFILMNISYSWIFEPVFLAFILYPYITSNKKINYVKTKYKHSDNMLQC